MSEEHSQALIPTPEHSPPAPVIRRNPTFLDIQVSTQTFLTTCFILLLLWVGYIYALYFYLYPEAMVLPFQQKTTAMYQPVTENPKSFAFQVNNPEDDLLIYQSSVVVSGKTAPLASLVITTSKEDLAFSADVNGDFTKVVSLQEGLNNLDITSIDEEGNIKQAQKTVYYSKEKL